MSELTDPDAWSAALAAHRPRPLDPAALGRLVVVAAHPDDETLAASGVMQAAHATGAHVELVVATDGEAAFPAADAAGREELRRARRRELREALHAQGLGDTPVHWLGLPDSALDDAELEELLVPLLAGADSYLAPWTGDPHPDHAAAGRAAARAAPLTTCGWSYPIWMWAWQQPGDPAIPWSRAFGHVLSPAAREAKRAAVRCFASQLVPGPAGEAPILPVPVLRYFDTDVEVLFRCPPGRGAPTARFGELYAAGDGDPCAARSSWFERRRRAVLLACLPRARYRWAAVPGCARGALPAGLAARCARLDASDAAVEVADAGTVAAGHPALPDPRTLPTGIDLAVLCEVLHHLGDEDLAATCDLVAHALVPGGDLVVAHRRGRPAGAPRDAVATHAVLAGDPRFEVLVDHADAEFLLHVLRRR